MLRPQLSFLPRCVIIVGDYGSGKTEIAVNLALHLASFRNTIAELEHVTIADLDLVNPYFRCREAMELMEHDGIEVVVPPGGHRFADLPILLPQIKGLLQDDRPGRVSVLDVGGDEVGSRVLAGINQSFDPKTHGFWFVVNANRPFNDTVQGCVRAIRRIEGASGLRVTGLVSNTHMMADTTLEMVQQGIELSEQISELLGIPIILIGAMDGLAEQLSTSHPVLTMRRWMAPPWLRRGDVQLNALNHTGDGAAHRSDCNADGSDASPSEATRQHQAISTHVQSIRMGPELFRYRPR